MTIRSYYGNVTESTDFTVLQSLLLTFTCRPSSPNSNRFFSSSLSCLDPVAAFGLVLVLEGYFFKDWKIWYTAQPHG